MGFKFYYVSNHQSNSAADYVVGTTYYKSLKEEYGHINPGIAWGMAKELIPGRGIKPQINIDLDFCREYRMHEEFTNPNRDPPRSQSLRPRRIQRDANSILEQQVYSGHRHRHGRLYPDNGR